MGVLGSFLATGTARNINGADYIIDGGQSKTTLTHPPQQPNPRGADTTGSP
jgi:hypothetical protein